jgi:hypothetical protein
MDYVNRSRITIFLIYIEWGGFILVVNLFQTRSASLLGPVFTWAGWQASWVNQDGPVLSVAGQLTANRPIWFPNSNVNSVIKFYFVVNICLSIFKRIICEFKNDNGSNYVKSIVYFYSKGDAAINQFCSKDDVLYISAIVWTTLFLLAKILGHIFLNTYVNCSWETTTL